MTVRGQEPPEGTIQPVVAVAATGPRRRPSGEAPPLPRHLDLGTVLSVAAVGLTVALELAFLVQPVRQAVTRLDTGFLRLVQELRSGPVVDLLAPLLDLGAEWPVRVLFLATAGTLLVSRRAHHLAVYLAVVLLSSLAVTALSVLHGRMRPAGVQIVGEWEGFSHPSLPVALVSVVAVGAVRTLLPAGRVRARATAAAAATVIALAASRLYLGVDHPSDVVAALGLGWALPMAAFGLLVPDEVFPVRYQGGTQAHVDVTGERGAAVVRALQQQLGLRATGLEPFGLAGSAGSMPLRISVVDAGGADRVVFGKLYTLTHLRSDRWYKLARMVLYGRLEDEKPFSTVRRLVEYEDHMLRLLRDAGLAVPQPYGLVEITPEREYVVVMEYFADAREVGDVALSDEEVDDGLRLVRSLWRAGVAHRDLKPSNLLVREGRVLLIDVAFATVRPTPWRQAVDLANMMLTLALSSSADRVYARASRQFAPEDVAEAFAATRSITVPTQLRSRLREDGRDLTRRFRALAPPRPAVRIQLWSLRRVLVSASVLALAVLGLLAIAAYAQVVNLV